MQMVSHKLGGRVCPLLTEDSPATTGGGEEGADSRARRYSRQRYRLAVYSFLLGLAYLLVMVFLGSRLLKIAVEKLAQNQWLQVLLYTLAFLLMYNIVAFPVSFYGGYVIERRFGLSRQSVGGWLLDRLKTVALSLVLLVPIVEVIYFFLRGFPNHWWLFGSLAWILFGVVLTRLAPVAVMPLFYKLKPLEAPEIKPKLARLAKEARLDISGVYQFNLSRETRKATAALLGWGRSRRVVLADTLLGSFTPEEIEAVFAHEVGHYVRGHVPRLIAWSGVGAFLGFLFCKMTMDGATGLLAKTGMLASADVSDIATLPLFSLLFSIFALVLLPLQNAYSRKLERESDLYALSRTGNYRAFMTALSKLAALNLLERTPNRLVELIFYTHPPVEKRIRLAYRLMKSKETGRSSSDDDVSPRG